MSAAPRSSSRQSAASDPRVSAWVSASAGTGKTHVLTDRVLRLLLAGSPPERILCLTFTKAAAAEMANRIQARLGIWASVPTAELTRHIQLLTGSKPDTVTLRRARGLFARVLDAPGGLKIQTIHAFCQSTLGRFPLEADIAPHFQAMDERTAAESMDAARERMLVWANDDRHVRLHRALSTLITLADESQFTELMTVLASDRNRVLRMLDHYGGVDGVADAVRQYLDVDPDESPETVFQAAVQDDTFDGAGLARAATALATGSAKDQERGATIHNWLDQPVQRLALVQNDYLRVFLTKTDDCRAESSLATKKVREGDAAVLPILLREQRRLYDMLDRHKAAATVQSTAALLELGAALLQAYEEEKSRHAVLDYDDLVLKTRNLLLAPGVAPWVLFKLDGGLDHILVDEAQDTNPDQWDVVGALADEFFAGEGAHSSGRTVFAVGDAKQSIYSFQRADPQRFTDMEDHFGAQVESAQEAWQPVELVESYRSVPAVLTLVDTVFADAVARDGVDARHDIRHVPHRRGHGGVVELWPTVEPLEVEKTSAWQVPTRRPQHATASARLAQRIAKTIRHWLDSGEQLTAHGRAMRPGDIMILVQRRSQFVEDMVRALKHRGIPVAGVDRMVLTEQLAVMDLVALGRLLLMPSDDLTLATVLKGPLIGFDEDTLFDLAYGRGKDTLWDTLTAGKTGSKVCRDAAAFLTDLLSRVDFESPYEFFAHLLGPEGGREKFVSRLGSEANDPLDEFLGLALAYEREHPPSMEAFLHWLESGQAEVKRDLEQGRDEVRVLTVHGAKGLQAPVVFLPDTCRTPRNEPSLLWLAGEDARPPLLAWSGRKEYEPAVLTETRQQYRTARDQEYRRLLYVALTRAADRLYVCGWENRQGRGTGCWYDLISPAMEQLGTSVTLTFGGEGLRYEMAQTAEVSGPGREADGRPAGDETIPGWATVEPQPEPTPAKPLAPSRPDLTDPPAASPLDRPDEPKRFLRGVLIHELLEVLPAHEKADRVAAADRHLAVRGADLTDDAREELVREVVGVLDSPAFAELFGPSSQAEVPVTGLVGGVAVSGQIDRLVVRDQDVIVVDFKSNRPPPTEASAVAPAYLRQMALYRELLRQIFPGRTVRCVLLWTFGPYLMPIDDTLLDRALT